MTLSVSQSAQAILLDCAKDTIKGSKFNPVYIQVFVPQSHHYRTYVVSQNPDVGTQIEVTHLHCKAKIADFFKGANNKHNYQLIKNYYRRTMMQQLSDRTLMTYNCPKHK